MTEVWSEDGRHLSVYQEPGHPAEWSDDPVPRLIRHEVFEAWGWRLAVRTEGGGERRPGPDSGARFPSREAALRDLLAELEKMPDLADLPIVDWLTGESLEDEPG